MNAKQGYNSKKGEGLRFKITEKELKKLYIEQKLSTTQISKIYDLSVDTIRIRLKDFGIQPTGQGREKHSEYRPNWTDEEERKVIEFYKSHPNCGDINKFSQELGRSRRAISIRASQLDLTKEWNIRKSGKLNEAQKDNVKKLVKKAKERGKLSSMKEDKARKLFEEFRKSKLGVTMFSKMKGYYKNGLAKVFRKYFPDEYEFLLEEKQVSKDKWYKKGRRFEYITRNYLQDKGFWVLRSPRSATSVDLVAIKKNSILMIQCKSGASGISSKEREDILQICQQTGACPILAYRPSPRKIAFKKCLKEGYLNVLI